MPRPNPAHALSPRTARTFSPSDKTGTHSRISAATADAQHCPSTRPPVRPSVRRRASERACVYASSAPRAASTSTLWEPAKTGVVGPRAYATPLPPLNCADALGPVPTSSRALPTRFQSEHQPASDRRDRCWCCCGLNGPRRAPRPHALPRLVNERSVCAFIHMRCGPCDQGASLPNSPPSCPRHLPPTRSLSEASRADVERHLVHTAEIIKRKHSSSGSGSREPDE